MTPFGDLSGHHRKVGYVADRDLFIVNVSSPTAPTLAGSYDNAGDAKDVAVSGNYAYVADYTNGLVILRTDVPVTPPKGDLNHDGYLTPADAAIALQIATGIRPCDPATLAAADVSGDNRVTSLDALILLQAATDAITL
ncbi:MAG: hypothetical protein C4B59_14515 [Candidatus Methanogaster sp.]|uniref:Uncharacterized protein n=1 Tax=Candidatus Methanogaster sp. TaxID=3386292 RepID=A0AC61KZ15_9EURY|nr:MAG: hypothetical protein C4B59_14515 [ANME-2 cluster archaeon]